MYLELITPKMPQNPWIRPQPPATPEQIRQAEEKMGVSFPQELRELLLELNGDRYLLLSAEKIVEYNLSTREGLYECYDGLEDLLFVAANGCGDYYCYKISQGHITDPGLYRWEHEDNETRPVASGLAEMITRYYNDEI